MAAFDTTFLIDLLRSQPAALALFDRIEDTGEAQVAPAPAVFELSVELGRGRTTPARARRIAASLDGLEVAPFTREMALEAGRLKGAQDDAGRPSDDVDCMIAASALVLGEPLVTRNRKHFERIPRLKLVSY